MKIARRNLFGMLAAAVFVPWSKVLPEFAKPDSRVDPLDFHSWGITAVRGINANTFTEGETIVLHGPGEKRGEFTVTYVDEIASTIFIMRDSDWPEPWVKTI